MKKLITITLVPILAVLCVSCSSNEMEQAITQYEQGDYEAAFSHFHQLANENQEANAYLAEMYYYGMGVKQNLPEAYRLSKIGADKNNLKSMVILGDLHLYKEDKNLQVDSLRRLLPFDKKQAFFYYEKAALLDYAPAQYRMAIFLDNEAEQKQWIEKAAEQGDVLALLLMADIADDANDEEQEFDYLERAADTGNPYAQFKLYKTIKHLSKADVESMGWGEWLSILYNYIQLEKECKKNYPFIYEDLAESALDFIRVNSKDYATRTKEALEYYEEGVKSEPQKRLPMYYELKNWEVLYRLNKKGGDYFLYPYRLLDISNCHYKIGDIYAYGKNIAPNHQLAILNFKKAIEARHDNSEAMYLLGLLHEYQGENYDFDLALDYYEKAAQLNNLNAQMRLGVIYFNGENVKQSYKKARDYFFNSAQFYRDGFGFLRYRDCISKFNLAILSLYGLGVKQDTNTGIKYLNPSTITGTMSLLFEKKCDANDSEAAYLLGQIYYYGWFGVSPEIEKAIHYLERTDNVEGRLLLGEILISQNKMQEAEDLYEDMLFDIRYGGSGADYYEKVLSILETQFNKKRSYYTPYYVRQYTLNRAALYKPLRIDYAKLKRPLD